MLPDGHIKTYDSSGSAGGHTEDLTTQEYVEPKYFYMNIYSDCIGFICDTQEEADGWAYSERIGRIKINPEDYRGVWDE